MKNTKSNTSKISGSFLLILLLLSIQAFGQTGEPKLLEKFSGNIDAETVMGGLDYLGSLTMENQTSQFVILLAGKTGDPIENIRLRYMVENRLKRSDRGDMSRLIFVKCGVLKEPAMEFWDVPSGFDIAEIGSPLLKDPESWDEDVSGLQKPVKLKSNQDWVGRSSKYPLFEDNSAGMELDLAIFVDLLKNNPNMRGNAVIYQISKKRFQRDSELLLQELSKRGIDRSRVKTFYVKTKGEQFETVYDYIPYPEYWILP